MTLNLWIKREVSAILALHRKQRITGLQAVRRLYGLGYTAEAAWKLVEEGA